MIKEFKEKYGVGWLAKWSKHKRDLKKIEQSYGEELYQVYYLPHANYCGVTMRLEARLVQHKSKHKRNVEDYIILYECYSKSEAFSVEAAFQRLCGFEGYMFRNLIGYLNASD